MELKAFSQLNLDCEVLIVGAGPTGLVLACDLVRRGVKCTVIEKDPPVQNARAMGLSARTLEILRANGVIDRVMAEVVVHRSMSLYLNRKCVLRLPFEVTELSSPFPFNAVLPQNRVVSLLEERLIELGGEVLKSHP